MCIVLVNRLMPVQARLLHLNGLLVVGYGVLWLAGCLLIVMSAFGRILSRLGCVVGNEGTVSERAAAYAAAGEYSTFYVFIFTGNAVMMLNDDAHVQVKDSSSRHWPANNDQTYHAWLGYASERCR